jgi:hypothetical protein
MVNSFLYRSVFRQAQIRHRNFRNKFHAASGRRDFYTIILQHLVNLGQDNRQNHSRPVCVGGVWKSFCCQYTWNDSCWRWYHCGHCSSLTQSEPAALSPLRVKSSNVRQSIKIKQLNGLTINQPIQIQIFHSTLPIRAFQWLVTLWIDR